MKSAALGLFLNKLKFALARPQAMNGEQGGDIEFQRALTRNKQLLCVVKCQCYLKLLSAYVFRARMIRQFSSIPFDEGSTTSISLCAEIVLVL